MKHHQTEAEKKINQLYKLSQCPAMTMTQAAKATERFTREAPAADPDDFSIIVGLDTDNEPVYQDYYPTAVKGVFEVVNDDRADITEEHCYVALTAKDRVDLDMLDDYNKACKEAAVSGFKASGTDVLSYTVGFNENGSPIYRTFQLTGVPGVYETQEGDNFAPPDPDSMETYKCISIEDERKMETAEREVLKRSPDVYKQENISSDETNIDAAMDDTDIKEILQAIEDGYIAGDISAKQYDGMTASWGSDMKRMQSEEPTASNPDWDDPSL